MFYGESGIKAIETVTNQMRNGGYQYYFNDCFVENKRWRFMKFRYGLIHELSGVF